MSDPTHWNAGDHHRWETPTGDPCPDCQCCTAALCERAITRDTACHHEGHSTGHDLSDCPCWQRGSAARKRLGVAGPLDVRIAELVASGMARPEAYGLAWREIHG